jgi:hypothetical protein
MKEGLRKSVKGGAENERIGVKHNKLAEVLE